MEEYISKDALMKAFVIRVVYGTSVPEWNDAMDIAESIPAADVVEVKHGRWIDRPSKRGYGMSTYCSCCGQHSGIGGIESNRHRAYCPNCGAVMDGGQE